MFPDGSLHEFVKANNRVPKPWNEADASALVSLAKGHFNEADVKVIKTFSYTAAGQLAPMCSVVSKNSYFKLKDRSIDNLIKKHFSKPYSLILNQTGI